MTSANLLARLRTLLDEASASFWTDAEAYAALADGQNAVIALSLGVYRAKRMATLNQDVALSKVLQSIFATQTATVASGASTASLTGTVFELVYVTYNHSAASPQRPCRLRNYSPSSEWKAANSFLVATPASGEYYIRFNNPALKFETASTDNAATWVAGALTQPTDIASGQNPVIPDTCMPAVLQFAFARMLSKDQRLQESSDAFGRFFQTVQAVIQ